MGVVNEESDQERAIPLVERNHGGLKQGPEMETRRPRKSGAGGKVFDDGSDNLPIILRECARGSSGPRDGLRIARRLAAADGFVTAAIGRLGRSHPFREKRGLRQQERQSKQRRQYGSGKFHASHHFTRRLWKR